QDLSQEFHQALGFLLRAMKTREELAALNPAQQPQRILFFAFMDSIPERQRVLLNEILTTRRFELPDETGHVRAYVLPPWIHVAVSCPEEHQFSSAFINRFDRPIRVRAITEPAEVEAVVRRRYSLVTEDEIEWVSALGLRTYQYDKRQAFALRYGFT